LNLLKAFIKQNKNNEKTNCCGKLENELHCSAGK
jgi:hypothetical protein